MRSGRKMIVSVAVVFAMTLTPMTIAASGASASVGTDQARSRLVSDGSGGERVLKCGPRL